MLMDIVSLDQVTSEISNLLNSVNSFTEAIDRHFESVGRSLKDAFRDTQWLPDSIKPAPPPIPRTVPKVAMPAGYFEATRLWVSEHRASTAAVVAFVGTGAFIVWRRRRNDRVKRRAGRAKNGSRTEVVILAGSPHSPLTRSLSLDLERRGFIVYIPVSTMSEEQIVQSESRADIRPLNVDITSVCLLHLPQQNGLLTMHYSSPLQKRPSGNSPHTSILLSIPFPTLHRTPFIWLLLCYFQQLPFLSALSLRFPRPTGRTS